MSHTLIGLAALVALVVGVYTVAYFTAKNS